MCNLYAAFQQNIKNVDKPLIITNAATYSFADIENYTARIANLLQNFGLKKGDRLAAYIEKSEFNLFLYLSCLRSGIIFLPLNYEYSNDELLYFFQDAKPKLVVCDPRKRDAINLLNKLNNYIIKTMDDTGSGTLLEQLNNQSTFHEICSVNPDATAVILYTSGTTGKPKGAMITHKGLISNALDLVKIWDISSQDTVLHMLPMFHVHGLFFALHTALLGQAKIILLPKFQTDMFFKWLPECTIFMGVPTYYIRLIKDKRLTKDSCIKMRLFISGSAPLLATTFNDFQQRTSHEILERYGMTETGINTSNPLNGVRKIGSVGLPLSSVNVRVVNDQNESIKCGNIGHIQIKGDNLFKGYWGLPEKNREEFTDDGFFKTGDLGVLDTNNYLTIVGRSKDLIISGGLNIYPKEIETTINGIQGVSESAVVGVPHSDFGEAVIAIVVKTNNILNEETVINTIKQHHASYKCPKKIIFVDQLPKNTMGKIQKNVLREVYWEIFA